MPDGGSPSVTQCGEELRRIVARRQRRRRRLGVAALIACAAVPTLLSAAWKLPMLLVWNASASAPVGLYRVQSDKAPKPGDMVIAWPPGPAREIGAARRYLPANVPLVKRVAAASGDRVCASGEAITINGARVAVRQRSDAAGRPMPWWSGCRLLGSDQYLLLMDSPRSFDGRYFGPTDGSGVVGRAVLLWAKPAKGSNDG